MTQGKVEICGVNTAKLPILSEKEKACLDTYKAVKSQTTCLTRLDFRLGDVQLGNL